MRSLLCAGLALGLATAACKESIAPKSLANPQATTAQMAALDTLFDISVLNSFSAMSGEIAPVAPARLATLRALAAVSSPLARSSVLRPYVQGVQGAQMLRQLLPNLTDANAAALFPPEVVGKTFEWNDATGMYGATARAGAPATGVRFILYAVDGLTGMPVVPLVEVGYVDLADESTASVAKLHVTVAGPGGTPVYVDYLVTLASGSTASARITSTGYITKGAASPDTLRFNGVITVSGNASSVSVTQDVTLDVNSRDLHVRLWEQVTVTQTTITVRIYFRFQHSAEVVTFEGNLAFNDLGTANGSFTVKVDGGRMATCTVTADANSYNLTCEGADADGLNADEAAALQAVGDATAKVQEIFTGLFTPTIGILGA